MFYSIAKGKCRLDVNILHILIFLFFIWTIKNFDIVIKDANSFSSNSIHFCILHLIKPYSKYKIKNL